MQYQTIFIDSFRIFGAHSANKNAGHTTPASAERVALSSELRRKYYLERILFGRLAKPTVAAVSLPPLILHRGHDTPILHTKSDGQKVNVV